MADEAFDDLLSTFGLSGKKRAIYETALGLGDAPIAAIAAEADVSRRYVYESAPDLADRGLIEVLDHASPTRLRALPPEDVVARQRDRLHALEAELEGADGDGDVDLEVLEDGFGLSTATRAAYEAVVVTGGGTVPELANVADISRPTAYEKYEELAERGLVEVADTTPRTVTAVPSGEVLGRFDAQIELLGSAIEGRVGESKDPDEDFEVVKTWRTVVKRLHALLRQAEDKVMLTIPAPLLDEAADELEAARERGVLVLLILSHTAPEGVVDPAELADVCTIAKTIDGWVPFQLTVDEWAGLTPPESMFTGVHGDRAVVFQQPQFGVILTGSFMGKDWPRAQEVYVTEPVDLPHTFDHFHHAALHATLHEQRDVPVSVSVEARRVRETGREFEIGPGGPRAVTDDEAVTIEGPIVDIRQNLVEPFTNEFPIECAFDVETPDGVVSVGSRTAAVEDYAAQRTTIRRADADVTQSREPAVRASDS